MNPGNYPHLMLLAQFTQNQLFVLQLIFVTRQRPAIHFDADKLQLLAVQVQLGTRGILSLNVYGAGHLSHAITNIENQICIHRAVIRGLVVC